MPLVERSDASDMNSKKDFEKITYESEYNDIFQSIKSTKKKVQIRKICATLNNFRQVLNEGTRSFHFSGHGLKDSLFFENEDGTGFELKEKDL